MDFKVLLLGDSGVGKTSFLKRLFVNKFEEVTPTKGCDAKFISFMTTDGLANLSIWDVSGSDDLRYLRRGYFYNANCALIFYDLTNEQSYNNVKQWSKELRKFCGNVPFVLVGNKFDCDGKMTIDKIKFRRNNMVMSLFVSIKSGLDINIPLLWLLKRLTENPNLQYYNVDDLLCNDNLIDSILI